MIMPATPPSSRGLRPQLSTYSTAAPVTALPQSSYRMADAHTGQTKEDYQLESSQCTNDSQEVQDNKAGRCLIGSKLQSTVPCSTMPPETFLSWHPEKSDIQESTCHHELEQPAQVPTPTQLSAKRHQQTSSHSKPTAEHGKCASS